MVRTVIIGAGDIARKRHIPALLRSQNGCLHGICNRSAQTTAELAEKYGVRAYASPQEVFSDPAVDAVLISTPPTAHTELAERALAAGKHVLLEKPMAMTVEEAERIWRAANASTAKLMMLHVQRFYDPHKKAKALLKQGAIGRLLSCRSFLCDGDAALLAGAARPGWFDALYNVSIHRIDLLRWLVGAEVQRVFCHRSQLLVRPMEGDERQPDDHMTAILQYENGVVGTLIASQTSYHGEDRSTVLIGTEGSILTYTDGHDVVVKKRNGEQAVYDFPSAHDQKTYELTDIHEQFFGCIVRDLPVPVTVEDGLLSVRTAAAMERSDRTGTWEKP